MVISVAIGFGLREFKKASNVVVQEDLLYQSSMVLDDVLVMLQSSPDLRRLADSNSSDELYTFLQSSQYLPFEIADEKIILSFESARSRLNINDMDKTNEALFRDYFNRYMVGSSYVDILKECMRKNQVKDEYNNYTSTLFDTNPSLFREYIASKKHLEKINNYYINEYGDTNLKNVPFDQLFSYEKNANIAIDLNYITADVWELILGVSKERAEHFYQGEGSYKALEDLDLNEDEKKNLRKFQTTFFAPYLLVKIEILKETTTARIIFKYDIKLKRGYDFVFKI